MTTREVQAAVHTALSLQGRASPKSDETEALGRFYDAIEEIKARRPSSHPSRPSHSSH